VIPRTPATVPDPALENGRVRSVEMIQFDLRPRADPDAWDEAETVLRVPKRGEVGRVVEVGRLVVSAQDWSSHGGMLDVRKGVGFLLGAGEKLLYLGTLQESGGIKVCA
jgi:hypothetical protein